MTGEKHGDVYGVCTCENCKCREVKDEPEGLVVDETGECESMSIIKKIFLILSLLAFTSCVAVGPRCTYTQDGTKLSSWVWFTKEIPVDLSKENCN